MRMLVGFGGLKGAGKDAAAEALERSHGYRRESFSVAIDAAARKMDPVITVGSRGERIYYSEYVDVVCGGDFTLAKTHPEVRRFLEHVGAFGRSINETVWLDRAEARVRAALDAGEPFALTGVRFPNELEMVRRNGGLTIWISRPDRDDTSSTAVTETSVRHADFDLAIINDGTLDELHEKVLAACAVHEG